ncbi:MAG: hypothetical protein EA370_02735 [Wenzhouxiangella sp.]|nr:MAG: hypothetical protein EA370_02735 [Wenzhouxiangella sp.]
MIRSTVLGGIFFLAIFLVGHAFATLIVVSCCNVRNSDLVGSAPLDMLHAKLERPLGVRSNAVYPGAGRVPTGGAALPGLRMSAEIEGEWDRVRGFVTLPIVDQDDGERYETTVRGFLADRVAQTNEYVVPGWDRTVFWVRFNDGLPGDVPRLAGAIEIVRDYQPEPDDGFEIFENDTLVQTYCTGTNFCTIQAVPYVELREPGVDYSDYPAGAAESVIFFVVDQERDVIAIVIDIYDANDDFVETRYLQEDDGLEFFSLAFKIDEPDVFYVAKYMEERDVTLDFEIELAYYVPGVDFVDPDLPQGFDAAGQRVQFMLEAFNSGEQGDTYAYAGPFDLGFDWQSLPEYIFRSNFQAPVADIRSTAGTGDKSARVMPARNR